MAGGPGFEPRLTESESAVLPLNYPPAGICKNRPSCRLHVSQKQLLHCERSPSSEAEGRKQPLSCKKSTENVLFFKPAFPLAKRQGLTVSG